MRSVGIVTEVWKAGVFKAHLDEYGFEYTQLDGPVQGCITLKVKIPTVAELQPVVQAAVNETKRMRGS